MAVQSSHACDSVNTGAGGGVGAEGLQASPSRGQESREDMNRRISRLSPSVSLKCEETATVGVGYKAEAAAVTDPQQFPECPLCAGTVVSFVRFQTIPRLLSST